MDSLHIPKHLQNNLASAGVTHARAYRTEGTVTLKWRTSEGILRYERVLMDKAWRARHIGGADKALRDLVFQACT